MPMISLDTALAVARQALANADERAERPGYYSGARTGIINSNAELRAALDMLIRATEETPDTLRSAGPRQHP
jgi:hypothetical protein